MIRLCTKNKRLLFASHLWPNSHSTFSIYSEGRAITSTVFTLRSWKNWLVQKTRRGPSKIRRQWISSEKTSEPAGKFESTDGGRTRRPRTACRTTWKPQGTGKKICFSVKLVLSEAPSLVGEAVKKYKSPLQRERGQTSMNNLHVLTIPCQFVCSS